MSSRIEVPHLYLKQARRHLIILRGRLAGASSLHLNFGLTACASPNGHPDVTSSGTNDKRPHGHFGKPPYLIRGAA